MNMVECFKVKFLIDNSLAIKMKSGAYILANRIGIYYKELLARVGVKIIDIK